MSYFDNLDSDILENLKNRKIIIDIFSWCFKFNQFKYYLIVHQRILRFYIIYNGCNLIFNESSNNN
jgi:hypothetical protein